MSLPLHVMILSELVQTLGQYRYSISDGLNLRYNPPVYSLECVKTEDQLCLLFKERGKVIHPIARFPFISLYD